MICNNCGNYMPDSTIYCPTCGANNAPAPGADNSAGYGPDPNYPVYDQGGYDYTPTPGYGPDYGYQAPSADQQALSTRILTFGILAIALSGLGIPGIIFGALKRKLVMEYESKYGMVTGKAKVGSILGQVGLIFGIVNTVSWGFYLIYYGCLICTAMAGDSYSSSYYYLISLFH